MLSVPNPPFYFHFPLPHPTISPFYIPITQITLTHTPKEHVIYIEFMCICVCSFLCMCAVQVSYSISSTGFSAPIGHQACVSYILTQWRTPWILILEVLASVLCVYLCMCVSLYICMPVHNREGGREWSGRCCVLKFGVIESAETEVSMCECGGIRCVYVWSEVNKYWQQIISSGRVAGGFDGPDWTHQQRIK